MAPSGDSAILCDRLYCTHAGFQDSLIGKNWHGACLHCGTLGDAFLAEPSHELTGGGTGGGGLGRTVVKLRLYINVHHAAFDGASLKYFERDLWALYQASVGQPGPVTC